MSGISSGVSLIFAEIGANTLMDINPELGSLIQGTICAAMIINEVIAVILAKFAFKWAGNSQNPTRADLDSLFIPLQY